MKCEHRRLLTVFIMYCAFAQLFYDLCEIMSGQLHAAHTQTNQIALCLDKGMCFFFIECIGFSEQTTHPEQIAHDWHLHMPLVFP